MQSESVSLPSSRTALAVAVSTVVAGTHGAQAQTVLEEIVVTASKRETSLQELPQQITAFTTEDIERRGFRGIDDYFRSIPSLSLGQLEPQGTTIVFRGVVSSGLQFGGNPTSAIYLDEQPITATGNNPDPRLIDIERVEALSGPQPSLFGDASQSGTLRIITNKPDSLEFDSWIDVTGTQVDGGEAGYDVSAMVNFPLIENQLAVRLVGFKGEEGGYVDNVLTTSPGGTKDNAAFVEDDVNDKHVAGGRASLRWTPNATWTIDGTAIFQETEQDGFADLDVDIGGFDKDDMHQARFNEENSADRWYQFGLTMEGKLGWADLVVHTSYFDRNIKYTADATTYQFTFQSFYPYYAVYDFNGDPIAYAFVETDTKRWTVESRLSTPADSDSRWSALVGFFYNKVESDSFFKSGNDELGRSPAFDYLNALKYYYDGVYVNGRTNNWYFGVYDENTEQFALFGEFGFDFTDNINITAGGRWFRVTNEFDLFQGALMQGLFPDPATDHTFTDELAKATETGFVPKATIKWYATPDKMIYFTYSEGFRRGGANPLRIRSILPRSYEADRLVNYEWGAKTEWLDGRLRINAAAWKMTWNNIQIQVSDPTPTVFALGIVNFPQADINGFEASFEWLPAEGWDISGSVGYTDAEIAETVTLFPALAPLTASEGDQLPLAPDWKANLGVEYNFQREWFGAQPYVRFDYSYTGDSINSLAGIEAAIVAQGPTPQDSYDILDFRIGLEAELWNAQFFVDNVWDERGEVFFNNRWIFRRLSINQPRTFGVSFRRSFKGF